ncbi:tetratricopeptide repeat protein, partial [Fusobacterium mortiferum]|uniref:tetratricopeptide repeat protein n=1 Tax=Fusobacterium mortiferum TaxID=850 RepID=UPI00195EC9E5|nr:tetratricopeptide repeat protein [Fusobacterium mortiferum]
MSILTKELIKKFEEAEYLNEILKSLERLQKEKGYTDEEMDKDLDVALWRAYVYNNMDSYEFFELSEKTLSKVKEKGIKNGIWCYRYSCALAYLRRFDEALKYSRLGTEVEPTYPWGWLQLGKLCYKFNLLDEAFNAIDMGLKLVPNDYEFLTLKDDIENDRGYAYANSHYINEEIDKSSEKKLIDIDDDKLYKEFLSKSELEKKLDILHKEDKNQEIIEIINSLPKEELTYNILGRLARAYNNNDEYEKGEDILLMIKERGEKDSLWNFRMGYSCYYSGKLKEAQKYLERCLELNPDELDGDILLRYTYSDLANKKLNEGKNEEAIEYLKKIIAIAKDNEGIIYGESELGYCLEGLNRYEEAVEEFKKAIDMGRDDIWIFTRLGTVYRELGKYDEALEEYFNGLKIDNNDIYINSEIAWIYDTIKNECNIGLKYLEKVKELGRDDVWINFEIGYSLMRLDRKKEALTYYLKAKKLGGDNVGIYSELGYCLDSLERYEEALVYLEKARELGRDDIWINSEIGYCLSRLERYEDGLIYLEKAKELGKNDIWLYSELGYCLKKLKKYEEALVYYETANSIGRDDEWLNVEIAECLGELGRIEEGIARLQKILTFKECDEILLNSQIGYMYGKINNSKEALKYLYRAEELGRKDVWLYSEIGWNLADNLETYQEALEYFNKAKNLGRDDAWLEGQIGFVLSKLGNYNKAIEHLEKAKFTLPNDSWITYQLGSAYRKSGDVVKAIEILEQSLIITQFRGWVELELAFCYALIEEKEKAKKYLKEAELYIG